eukprot:89564-Chlamydomonas_euryale.AAC.2
MAWASHRGEHNWRVGRAPRVVEVDARDAGADHGKRVVDVEEAGRVSVAGACQALWGGAEPRKEGKRGRRTWLGRAGWDGVDVLLAVVPARPGWGGGGRARG